MAIANQGYRRDLNLEETINDTVALDNLAGAGTADDLSYLQNNLRNSSNLSFNSVDSNGFFSFANDREIGIDSIESKGDFDEDNNPINRSSVSINLTNPYLIKFGDLIEISGISVDGNAEKLNGQYSVIAVSSNLKRVTFIKSGLHYSNTSISNNAVTFKLKVQKIFVFTDGDVINLSENVIIDGNVSALTVTGTGSGYTDGTYTATTTTSNGKGTGCTVTLTVASGTFSTVTVVAKGQNYKIGDTLTIPAVGSGTGLSVTVSGIDGFEFTENTNYYVVESDGVSKFKLSTTSGGSAIAITGNSITSDNFQFKRQDAVHQEQIINFIKPQIQDTEFFSYVDDINGTFESTQSNIESAEFFSLKKYRADKDSTTSESIKIEGSVNLHDPKKFNENASNLESINAPGIYIGDTRAFSSDNNPWNESADKDGGSTSKLTTDSDEVKIGELAFLDGTPLDNSQDGSMIITGIDNDVSTVSGVVASSFTHKLPVQVQDSSGNKETYYLLLTEN